MTDATPEQLAQTGAGRQTDAGQAASAPAAEERLPTRVVAAYSSLTLPTAALGLPITVYLPPFYAQEMGLGLAVVGTVFMIARMWDVVTDPVMGIIIDRFPTRWGRRRHWIVLSVPILLISAWFIYMPSHETHSAAYLLGWLIVLYVGYTFLTIAHQSWGAELAEGYHERSRLYGWREIAIIVGMVTVLALPAVIERQEGADIFDKIASMGWYVILLLPITAFLIVTIVPDRRDAHPVHIDWRKAGAVILRNTVLRRCLVADFATAVGTGITGSTYIFLATWVFELPQYASLILLAYFVAGLLAMPAWMRISYRLGKHQTLIVAMAYGAATLLGYLLIADSGALIGLAIATMVYGFAFGAAPMILRAMMADLSDMDELETGAKRSGLFFALLTTTSKVGGAMAVGISYTILGWIGFDPSAETNTEAAVDGLLYTFILLPSLFFAIAGLAVWRYPLDAKRHQTIRDALAERAAD